MPAIFSKNCILSGLIDYYCLICSKHFKNDEETISHIGDPVHRRSLKSSGYFDKFKEDFIKKIKGYYFCELCGLTFPTATKVGLHIADEGHVIKKGGSTHIQRINNDIVAYDHVLISDEAWNGLVDDTCILCNVELDEDTAHKISQTHILNVIKSKVIFEPLECLYRKIDESFYQCLTCNIMFNGNEHLKSSEHKSAYKNYDSNVQTDVPNDCKDDTPEILDNNSKTNNITTVKVGEQAKETNRIDNSVDNKNNVTGNDNKTKKKASENVNKQNVKNKLKQPSDSFKKNTTKDCDEVYFKNLGAKNFISDKDGDTWCILCEWFLDVTPEEHIRGKHHQAILKLHKERIDKNMNNKNNVTGNDNKTKLFESVEKYQKSNININMINETAVCKKCSINIEFNVIAIEKHIEEHKQNSNKKAPKNAGSFNSGVKSDSVDGTTLFTKPIMWTPPKEKQPRSQVPRVEDFAKQHGLTHNRADNSFYCGVCCRRLPTTLKALENHVSSTGHTEKVAQSSHKGNEIKKPEKVACCDYVESMEFIRGTIHDVHDVIINDKHCINLFCLALIAKFKNTIMCHACDIDLTEDNVLHHMVTSEYHKDSVDKCLFITSLENEFIREIKLNVYHCGYCNGVVHDWEDVLEHIATEEHLKEKTDAQRRLRAQPTRISNTDNFINGWELERMMNCFRRDFNVGSGRFPF